MKNVYYENIYFPSVRHFPWAPIIPLEIRKAVFFPVLLMFMFWLPHCLYVTISLRKIEILIQVHPLVHLNRELHPECDLLAMCLWSLMIKCFWTLFSLMVVTFHKSVFIEWPSIVCSMWIDHKGKRYIPVRLSVMSMCSVCVVVCVCGFLCVRSVRIRSILY